VLCPHAQAERDHAEGREQEQKQKCAAERDKRIVAESDLASERKKMEQLLRARDHAVSQAVDKVQEQLLKEIPQKIAQVCGSAHRTGSNRSSSSTSLHVDGKRARTDDSIRSASLQPKKSAAGPEPSRSEQHHDRETAAAAGHGFSTIPETLNQSDTFGMA
jgi:hypothetical protein